MSIEACAELTRKGDPDRFLATMAGSPIARQKLFPLYAFNLEVARAPWVTQEPLIAEMRLQWWLDVLEEIETGKTVRSHEVATPLAAILTPDLALALRPLVEARKWDISKNPFANFDALTAHIDTTSGLLAAVASAVLGGPQAPARDLGNAQGAAAWLRAVPALFSSNRQPLPGDFFASVSALAEHGLASHAKSRTGRKGVPISARPAFLTGFEAPLFLNRAKADPAAVLSGDIQISQFRRKFRLLRLSLAGTW